MVSLVEHLHAIKGSFPLTSWHDEAYGRGTFSRRLNEVIFLAYTQCQCKRPLVGPQIRTLLQALDDVNMSHEAGVRAELATRDAVSRRILHLANLPGGFEERERAFVSARG